MRSFVIGLVLAVVVLVAGFLVPRLLPAATGAGTLRALEDAELARRQLQAYDPSLPFVAARADTERLESADFDTLVPGAQDEFEQRGKEVRELVQQAKRADQTNRMPPGQLPQVSANPAGVRAAVTRFAQSLRDNQKLLTEAVKNSRAASQSDRGTLGVEQVAGAVKLVEASKLLAEARRLRARLIDDRARLVAAAVEWAGVRAEKDHFAGMDVAQIRAALNADLEEISAGLAEAEAQSGELSTTVAEREQLLARLRAELETARTERLTMEELGFRVGDDASFSAYRARYLNVAERLRELQEQEQLLAYGGIQGGRPAADDLAQGAIEGGETVLGLDELQRRLAIVKEKVERLRGGRKALEDQLNLVAAIGTEAQTQTSRSSARLDELAAEVVRLRQGMDELEQQASGKEEEALRAARDAARAFGNAVAAVQKWKSDASALQREKDPQRTNDRLKRITSDANAGDFVSNFEARAKTLAGRILTERALGLGGHLDVLKRVAVLMPGSAVDLSSLEGSLNTARDEAVNVLGEARDTYQRLAQRQNETSWVHLSSLAAVYHLLWQIDEFNAAQHRSDLIDRLGKAVDRRQDSPFLQSQVEWHRLLTGEAAPQPEPAEGEAEPADQETDGQDEGE